MFMILLPRSLLLSLSCIFAGQRAYLSQQTDAKTLLKLCSVGTASCTLTLPVWLRSGRRQDDLARSRRASERHQVTQGLLHGVAANDRLAHSPKPPTVAASLSGSHLVLDSLPADSVMACLFRPGRPRVAPDVSSRAEPPPPGPLQAIPGIPPAGLHRPWP